VPEQAAIAVIRPLAARDIPDVLQLAAAAGWNQTDADIEMLLQLAPKGCFGIETEGRVVSTATLVLRDDRLAWLGMVLTDPAYRRRGFARRLVERCLEHAKALGITTVKLDATDAGRPLYLSLGFQDEEAIERWSGRLRRKVTQAPARDMPLSSTVLSSGAYDKLTPALAARSECFTVSGAFALVRSGARARYLGPFIANSSDAASELMEAAFSPRAGDLFYWDILPANRDAVALARQFGFERVRSLIRMSYGAEYRQPGQDRVYAICGFELG
jgi:GNAT superfamily N-acetyltransferase